MVGVDPHARARRMGRHPAHRAYRCVQPRVGDARQHALHVMPRAAAHRAPWRAVGHPDQAVVVAEPDHRGDREAQHLVGRAAPDATQHRQQVPVAEGVRVTLLDQKIADRLLHRAFFATLGDGGGTAVEAHQIAQHAQEARPEQVAALGEHRVEIAAAPFQRTATISLGHLHRKRHLRRGGIDLQVGKQLHQLRVGGVVEHQEAGVDAKGHTLQREIDRVGVTAEMAVGLEKHDIGVIGQAPGGR